MEFTIKHLSDTLDSYKQFVDEQQVASSAIFRQIIDRVNMTSEDLSKTKTEVLAFLHQLDDKNSETKKEIEEMKKEFEEMKKEFEEMKKEFAKMRQQLSDTNKELQQTKLNLAQSFESEW
jgi:uncharacterized coiled-coil DUF342 family protein